MFSFFKPKNLYFIKVGNSDLYIHPHPSIKGEYWVQKGKEGSALFKEGNAKRFIKSVKNKGKDSLILEPIRKGA